MSARDVARAALEQLTEVLGARHGTGQAPMLPALASQWQSCREAMGIYMKWTELRAGAAQ